jgi:predicted RNA-binding Zn-ribbon protein involved in translation (DUF1610 family)
MDDGYITDVSKWVKEQEVKAFMLSMSCPKCGEEMVYQGVLLPSNPPWYEHMCNKCGMQVNLRKKYPCIVHKHCKEM